MAAEDPAGLIAGIEELYEERCQHIAATSPGG
jgi:hypothetical protein